MKWSLENIADRIGARLKGNGSEIIRGVAPFDLAGTDHLTFAEGPKYLKRLNEISAGAVIVPEDLQGCTKNLLIVDNPKVAFAKVMELFHPPTPPPSGISPQASVGEGVSFGEDVSIAPLVFIGNNVSIGHRVVVHPGVVIGDDVIIGDDTLIYPNVSVLERCRVGRRVIINAGTVIGGDGFGFAPSDQGHYKIPQVGIVQIDDDVEIGVSNTIDRATLGVTHIHRGVKTDNLVHIAHNVTVGEHTIIVAQVVIGGSATIGKNVIIAGGAAISNHVTVGDRAIIGPRAGIAKPVPEGHIMSGSPEMPHRTWLKVSRILPELPDMRKRILALEKKMKEIDNG